MLNELSCNQSTKDHIYEVLRSRKIILPKKTSRCVTAESLTRHNYPDIYFVASQDDFIPYIDDKRVLNAPLELVFEFLKRFIFSNYNLQFPFDFCPDSRYLFMITLIVDQNNKLELLSEVFEIEEVLHRMSKNGIEFQFAEPNIKNKIQRVYDKVHNHVNKTKNKVIYFKGMSEKVTSEIMDVTGKIKEIINNLNDEDKFFFSSNPKTKMFFGKDSENIAMTITGLDFKEEESVINKYNLDKSNLKDLAILMYKNNKKINTFTDQKSFEILLKNIDTLEKLSVLMFSLESKAPKDISSIVDIKNENAIDDEIRSISANSRKFIPSNNIFIGNSVGFNFEDKKINYESIEKLQKQPPSELEDINFIGQMFESGDEDYSESSSIDELKNSDIKNRFETKNFYKPKRSQRKNKMFEEVRIKPTMRDHEFKKKNLDPRDLKIVKEKSFINIDENDKKSNLISISSDSVNNLYSNPDNKTKYIVSAKIKEDNAMIIETDHVRKEETNSAMIIVSPDIIQQNEVSERMKIMGIRDVKRNEEINSQEKERKNEEDKRFQGRFHNESDFSKKHNHQL